nr:hypothetical protein [Tanacetum cinerariifolium]
MDSSSPYKSGPWFQIMRLKDDLSSYGVTLPSIFKRKVENGSSTRFWVDQWLGGPPLCSTFPRLYRHEHTQETITFLPPSSPITSSISSPTMIGDPKWLIDVWGQQARKSNSLVQNGKQQKVMRSSIVVNIKSTKKKKSRMTIRGPDGIELDVWNDGIFMVDPLRYDSGVLLNMFVVRLKFKEFEKMIIKETNCANLFAMYYRIPDRDLEKGLVKIVNDYDLIHMYDMSKMYGGIELYFDHCDIDLSQYLTDPDPSTAEKEAEEEAMLKKGKEKTNVGDKGKKKCLELGKPRPPPFPNMAAFASTSRATASNKNEVLVEHDDFIVDLLRKMKGDGEDSNLQDPFVGVKETKDTYPTHDQSTHWRMKTLKLGKKFVDAAELKNYLTYYALSNGYSIWFERCSQDVLIVVCGQRPPTLKEPSVGKKRKQFRYHGVCKEDIKSLKPEKNCVRNFKFGSLVDYKWIGRHFGDKIRKNHEIKLCDIVDLVMKKYKCTITPNHYRSAKIWAFSEYEKTREEHYRLFRSYGKELLDTNPGSTVKLRVTNTDDKTYYDRFHVCFGGLKEQFKNWCRRVFALDGCFLKSPNQGADLDMPTGQGLTLMSDQHKGLIEAVKQVMPNAEHMQMNTIRKISATWSDDICPSILKRIDLMKNHTRFWHVIHTGGDSSEVRSGSDALKMPEEYVPNWFRKHLYYATYHNYLSLVGGIDFWPDQSQFYKVLPPKPRVMSGRPRKKRIRASHEGGSGTRVSKVGRQVTCQNCFQVGHNKKGCKAPPVQKPVIEKKKARRPRKADAADVGGSTNPLGGSANPLGGSATGVVRNATGLGRYGSGVGRSESGMGVNATCWGRSATLIDDEGVNESANQHDDGIDVGGSTNVFVGSASGVGGSVQGTGGSGIGRGVVRGCDIPGLKWSPF